MADLERITSHPEVMLGKPVVRDTRVTVEHILDAVRRALEDWDRRGYERLPQTAEELSAWEAIQTWPED